MKTLILPGGLNTRISEETVARPKPMVEVGGKPLLWHIMKGSSAPGIDEFIVCCSSGYVINEYFANYFLHMSDVTFDRQHNPMEVHQGNVELWRVTLVYTGEQTVTGAARARAELPRQRRFLHDLRRRRQRRRYQRCATLSFQLGQAREPNLRAAGRAIGRARCARDAIDDGVDERVDLIKMDIEGAEIPALVGCLRTLKAGPDLAIAAYRRPDDLVQIPAFLRGAGYVKPAFDTHVADYSDCFDDTILYFVKR
jgi:hypothetical protein